MEDFRRQGEQYNRYIPEPHLVKYPFVYWHELLPAKVNDIRGNQKYYITACFVETLHGKSYPIVLNIMQRYHLIDKHDRIPNDPLWDNKKTYEKTKIAMRASLSVAIVPSAWHCCQHHWEGSENTNCRKENVKTSKSIFERNSIFKTFTNPSEIERQLIWF